MQSACTTSVSRFMNCVFACIDIDYYDDGNDDDDHLHCCCCDSPAALLLSSVEEVCDRSRVVPQVLHCKLRWMALTVEQMHFPIGSQ